MECGCQRVEFGSRSRAAAAGVGLSPERPSIRVEIMIAISNTQCFMRSGTQSAAQGEANPSFLRFRVSGSPCCFSVASTRDNFRFDVACGRGLLSRFVGTSLSQIAWGEGRWGNGGGNLGVLLVPAPVEPPAGPDVLTQPVLKFAEVILVFVLQSASWAPAGGTLVSRYFQSWTSSLRARATIPIRRCRLLPRPKRV
jgi:hypothetical protein